MMSVPRREDGEVSESGPGRRDNGVSTDSGQSSNETGKQMAGMASKEGQGNDNQVGKLRDKRLPTTNEPVPVLSIAHNVPDGEASLQFGNHAISLPFNKTEAFSPMAGSQSEKLTFNFFQ